MMTFIHNTEPRSVFLLETSLERDKTT